MWDKREMIFIDYICSRRRCQDLGEAPNVTKNDTHLTWNLSDDIVKVLCWLSWWGLEWDAVSCLFFFTLCVALTTTILFILFQFGNNGLFGPWIQGPWIQGLNQLILIMFLHYYKNKIRGELWEKTLFLII